MNDPRDVLLAAEDIDDVHGLIAREHLGQLRQLGHRHLPEDGLCGGRHRNDAITEALQGTRDAVVRSRRIGRQPDHGDDGGAGQQRGDLLGRGN